MHGQDVLKARRVAPRFYGALCAPFLTEGVYLKMLCTKVLSAPRQTVGECIPKTLS